MRGYCIYALLVLAGFGLWLVLFSFMRKEPGRNKDFAGFLLIGPLHSYLKQRGYSLTKRELVGWLAVLLLMLSAPLVTWWLES